MKRAALPSQAPTPRHTSVRDASGRQTIRRRLEADAWQNHREFARKLAEQKCRVRPKQSGLRRRDLALLSIAITLMLVLLVRSETAQADTKATSAQSGPQAESWGLVFAAPGETSRAVALDTDISADITGMVARVEVRQRFRNTGRAWAEAVYRYPLPIGAAVDRLLVDAGGRILQGEIQEKQTAQRRYQQARAEGMVAALVEQEASNQFETRLANIGPDEEITITIGFLAPVDYRDEAFSFQLPLTFTPRWDPTPVSTDQPEVHSSAVPSPAILPLDQLDDHRLTLNIDLRSGLNIASLDSRYHDMEIHPALGGYHLFLADPDTRTDRVFELTWKPDFGAAPAASLMTWDGGDAVYALLMLAPPLPESIAPQPREVVFVIDTSGSMEGVSLQQARAALYQGLDHLGQDDYFNLIEFNSDSYLLFESSVPADEAGLQEAMDFIDGLIAEGGTEMAPALKHAMALPAQTGLLRQIVFITDGSVGNEDQLLGQIADELDESRLFTVSIGPAPNTAFMRKAAAFGRGQHTHIGKLEEVEERMTALWTRIANPALQDIRVDWGAGVNARAEYFPEIIPDLYSGEPLWLYARLPHEPREITLRGVLDGQPWELTSAPQAGSGSENLASLWARNKIEALQDSRLFGADPELTQLEITALALDFGMITPYTSLVAVDRTPARPGSQPWQTDVVPSLLPAGSSMTALGFSATATGWLGQFLMALVTLFAATCLLWFCSPPRRVQADGVPAPPPPARRIPSQGECRSHSPALLPRGALPNVH